MFFYKKIDRYDNFPVDILTLWSQTYLTTGFKSRMFCETRFPNGIGVTLDMQKNWPQK